jgi:hypothetical protein
MASVHEATDVHLGRHVALKVMAPELVAGSDFRERFRREARFAASLDQPKIVPIYEAAEAAGLLFIAMRFVRGGNLAALLRRTGPLNPEHTLAILGPVAEQWTPTMPPTRPTSRPEPANPGGRRECREDAGIDHRPKSDGHRVERAQLACQAWLIGHQPGFPLRGITVPRASLDPDIGEDRSGHAGSSTPAVSLRCRVVPQ